MDSIIRKKHRGQLFPLHRAWEALNNMQKQKGKMATVLRMVKFEWDNNKPFLWKEKEMTDSKKASVINHHPCVKFHSYMLQYLVVMLEKKQKGQKLIKQVYKEQNIACWNCWALSVVQTVEGDFRIKQEFQQLYSYYSHKGINVKYSSNKKNEVYKTGW